MLLLSFLITNYSFSSLLHWLNSRGSANVTFFLCSLKMDQMHLYNEWNESNLFYNFDTCVIVITFVVLVWKKENVSQENIYIDVHITYHCFSSVWFRVRARLVISTWSSAPEERRHSNSWNSTHSCCFFHLLGLGGQSEHKIRWRFCVIRSSKIPPFHLQHFTKQTNSIDLPCSTYIAMRVVVVVVVVVVLVLSFVTSI